jgi:ketosteroid isomerase-like protein
MLRSALRLAAASLALAWTLSAAGCGGDGGEQSAQQAAISYAQARVKGDAATVCDLYTDQLKEQLGASDNCEAFVREQTSGGSVTSFTVRSVKEDGDTATATLETPGEAGEPVPLTVRLERQDGDWKITSLGGGQASGD